MVDRREFRFEFPCPQCQARLRLQDRSLIGTRWNCPECRVPLLIQDGGQGALTVAIPPDATPLSIKPVRREINPQAAAALVAVTLIAGLAVFVLWTPEPVAPPPAVSLLNQAPVKSATKEEPREAQPPAPAHQDPVEGQLSVIGKWLNGQHDKNGAFPSAVVGGNIPVSERLGWLAQYREETEPGESVHPSLADGWKDPANEPFVRRRAASLLNPRVTAIASEDGFPATHYVGVAGVGADAAQLSKSHPRAGVFGVDRRTTRDDITDGTANTLLVVGVETQPSAWASGTGSVRGLTAEPYFGGPDHLGTGQPDGMLVLMADGSVRMLSKTTDPKLMRRMAAMADGLPLDANVPGEPSDPATPPAPPPVAQADPPALEPVRPETDPPAAAEATPAPPVFDVERGLSVAVSKFHLDTPVPLRTVLQQVVEMSALPIDTTEVKDDPRLDQMIELDLKQTTLRGVLEATLEQAKLGFTADSQGIHLKPNGSKETP